LGSGPTGDGTSDLLLRDQGWRQITNRVEMAVAVLVTAALTAAIAFHPVVLGERRTADDYQEPLRLFLYALIDGSATTYPVARMAGFARIADLFGSSSSNNGLEGITLDSAADEVVVIKETGPRLLIRISADLSTILGADELTEARGFVCDGSDDVGLDVSVLTYDPARSAFWILSDEGSCMYFHDPMTGKATGLLLAGSVEHPKRRLKNRRE
jgi:hypothetical protein